MNGSIKPPGGENGRDGEVSTYLAEEEMVTLGVLLCRRDSLDEMKCLAPVCPMEHVIRMTGPARIWTTRPNPVRFVNRLSLNSIFDRCYDFLVLVDWGDTATDSWFPCTDFSLTDTARTAAPPIAYDDQRHSSKI